jgi:hypothetical protein
MADNVAITAGSGTTVAADEVVDGTLGTVKAQFVKVMDGTLDSTNKWIVNSSGQALVLSQISDGTNTPAIKAASTAPVATDKALVVGISPNDSGWVGTMGSPLAVPSANFTRPADTTAYASGDLVANSTTAASVVALSWTAARVSAGSFLVRRARLKKSGTTTSLATFRLHLYGADPAASSGIANGDNGVWSTNYSSYLGSLELDITSTPGRAFRDSSGVIGVPSVGSEISVKLASGQTIYGLLEARAAYSPGNAEVFTVELELLQN